MVRQRRNLVIAVLAAALLWFYMFSPWTAGRPNFWIVMSCSAMILTTLAVSFTPKAERKIRIDRPLQQIAGGIALAFALWGIFWIGDKASQWLFDFARPEVDAVYSMKTGLPTWLIAVLLLVLIGPAEEFFWRGYVQKTLSKLFSAKDGASADVPAHAAGTGSAATATGRAATWAFIATAVIYALVHIWSFNFMLIMAALVAGLVWGFIYRICPKALPALIISHALWDVLVFVVMPI